jgi:hypothetical protein
MNLSISTACRSGRPALLAYLGAGLFLAGQALAQDPFAGAAPFPGSTWESTSVCAGDIDRDGDLDVLFGNRWFEGGNYLFYNDGSGFPGPFAWQSGEDKETNAVACGDLDGDGWLDVVCANTFFGNEAYLNQDGVLSGAHSWLSAQSLDSRGLALADLDGDGWLDVVAANRGAAGTICFGGPDSLQTVPGWFSPDLDNSLCVACGDVNGDGRLDLVFGNEWQPNTLYLNGPGGFGQDPPDWTSIPAGYTTAVALGDLDGDGRPDLVCGNGDPDSVNVNVYMNDGTAFSTVPDWSTETHTAGRYATMSVALGDIDGDGDLDLACGNYEQPNTVYYNDGAGDLGPAPVWEDDAAAATLGVALADIDGDGLLDLICANDQAANTWYANRLGPAEPAYAWELAVGMETEDVALGDVDGDGDLDLVCARRLSASPNALHLNEGGTLQQTAAWVSETGFITRDVALGDVDGDGDPDLVCGNDGYPDLLYPNVGGTFAAPSWTSPSAYFTYAVVLGDVDGDGDLDLVCGNRGDAVGEPNTLFLNEGGVFGAEPAWISGPANMTEAVALGDVDGDGRPDLVCGNVGSEAGAGNTVYLNLGGVFEDSPSWVSAEANATISVALGDIDGDGRLDLVCGNGRQSPQPVNVYLNAGGTLSGPVWSSDDAAVTTGLVLFDLDADGDLDLVRSVFDAPNLVHLGEDGNLHELADWATEEAWESQCVAVGDVDGDNDPDLLFGQSVAGQPVVLHRGHFGSAWRADPADPAHALPHHPAYVGDAALSWVGSNTYRLDLTAVDPQGDDLYLVAEYQLVGDPTWHPADLGPGGRAVGPLAASPAGETHQLFWNVYLAPLDPRDVVLRLRSSEIASGVSRYTAVPNHLIAPLRLLIERPQITLPVDQLAFPTLTVGDDDTLAFEVRNTGTESLEITGAPLPGAEMRLQPEPPLTLAAGESVSLEVHLEPRTLTDMSGPLLLLSDDPITPVAQLDVSTDILPLDFTSRLLTQEEVIPLGDGVTVIVTPAHQVNVQGGHLLFRPTGAAAFLDSLPLVPDAADFIAVVPGESVTELGLDYYVRVENNGVFATDPAGAPAAFHTQAVQAPARVDLRPLASSEAGHDAGQDVVVEAELPAGSAFVDGELHYRRGGDAAWRQAVFSLQGMRPTAVIPDSLVGACGLEYRGRVQTLTTELFDPPGGAESDPHVLPVSVSSLVQPVAAPAATYQLVSIPLDFGADFTGTLESMLYQQPAYGSYDPVRWRCYRYNPLQADYRELPDAPAAFTLAPGRAFWLISRGSGPVDTAPLVGASPSTAAPWTVVLHDGWNQVGHPFAFPVAWDSVTVDGLAPDPAVEALIIEPPVAWDWTDRIYVQGIERLEPFGGYWLRNLSGEDVVLAVPPVRAPDAARSRAVPALPPDAWRLELTASCGDRISEPAAAGVHPQAAERRDPLDRSRTPAPPGPELAVVFPHPGWIRGPGDVLEDWRPPIAAGEGRVWDLALIKTFAREGIADEVTLRVDALAAVPGDLEVALHDRVALQQVDLRDAGVYTFNLGLSSAPDEPRFRLLVGDAQFVGDALADLATPPCTALRPNRPNPFNPATLLRFDLDRDARVTLDVHDMRGRLVVRLLDGIVPAGRREVPWTGRDRAGRDVAAGVYFYRLQTDFGYRATGKMSLVR